MLEMWKNGSVTHYWWECKMLWSLWKILWQFLIWLNYTIQQLHLDIYPRKMKIYLYSRTVHKCSERFIHNSKKWETTLMLFNVKWLNKMLVCPYCGIPLKWMNCCYEPQLWWISKKLGWIQKPIPKVTYYMTLFIQFWNKNGGEEIMGRRWI